MVRKVVHAIYIVLLAAFAVVLCINCIRALNSGYEKTEFTVTRVYTNHSTNTSEISLQVEVDNKLVIPDNKLTTKKSYNVGETVAVWYDPDSNMISQNFMSNIVLQFTCAGIAIACIIVTLPRKRGKNAK